ncbi:MAG: hypothetical protein ACRDB9_07665 [Cetobacterium sp.]
MSKTILGTARTCKVTLETPYEKVETDTYMLFAKKDGTNMIEVNNLDVDEIIDFRDRLNKLIERHEKELRGL